MGEGNEPNLRRLQPPRNGRPQVFTKTEQRGFQGRSPLSDGPNSMSNAEPKRAAAKQCKRAAAKPCKHAAAKPCNHAAAKRRKNAAHGASRG